MAILPISEEFAKQIRDAAQQEQLEVEDFLRKKLLLDNDFEGQASEDSIGEPLPGTLAAMAESAHRANLRFGTDETIAERSREILREQTKKRLNERKKEQE